MGNSLKKPILQEYLSPGQSRMVADRAEIIGEDGQKKKHWYLNGIFIQGEIENLNGRIYPREEIHSAIDQLNEQIKQALTALETIYVPTTRKIAEIDLKDDISSESLGNKLNLYQYSNPG